MEGLREADEQQHLPLGYLARARLNFAHNRPKDAEEDLAEVLKVAEPSGMLLHLTDYHLVYAGYGVERGDRTAAKGHLDTARDLIARTGYHRRDEELKGLEGSLLDKEKTGKR